MSKRPGDSLTAGNNAKKNRQEDVSQDVVNQKFFELQRKLAELHVHIDNNFVKKIVGPLLSDQKKFLEFLLRDNEKIQQPEFYKLQVWQNHQINSNIITSIINYTRGESAQITYNKLFDVCFRQQGDNFIPAWFPHDSFVPFSTRILRNTRTWAPEILQALLDKCFEKDGSKTKLFIAIEKYGLSSQIGSIITDSRKSTVQAFNDLIKELFVEQADNLLHPSNSFQAILIFIPLKDPYGNPFLSCLTHSGSNAKQNYQNLLKLLFNKQGDTYTLKPEIDPNKIQKTYIIDKIKEKLQEASTTIPKTPTTKEFFNLLAKAVGETPSSLTQGNIEGPRNSVDEEDVAGPSNRDFDEADNIIESHIQGFANQESIEQDNIDLTDAAFQDLAHERVISDDFLNFFDNDAIHNIAIENGEVVPIVVPSAEFNIDIACGSGSGRSRREVSKICVINEENYEKFENRKTFEEISRLLTTPTAQVASSERRGLEVVDNRVVQAFDKLNTITVIFQIGTALNQKDYQRVETTLGMNYVPQLAEYIAQKLPAKFGLLKTGISKAGSVMSVGFAINDLANAAKDLTNATNQYQVAINEVRITTDAGFIVIPAAEITDAIILGTAGSGVGMIAAVVITVVSDIAEANISTKEICHKLGKCTQEEFNEIFASFALGKDLTDKYNNDIAVRELYMEMLRNVGKKLLANSEVDALTVSLPEILVERIQKYQGIMHKTTGSRLNLEYCGIDTERTYNMTTAESSIVNIVSFTDHTKYSWPTRIVSLPDNLISYTLACNPNNVYDVIELDTIPGINDPTYTNYHKKARICGDCEGPISQPSTPTLGQISYPYTFYTEWLCNNNNIPCLTGDSSSLSRLKVTNECNNATGRIKSRYPVGKLVLREVEVPKGNNHQNYCHQSVTLMKSSVLQKPESKFTAVYNVDADSNVVKAGDNTNIIRINKPGNYTGGESHDVVILSKKVGKAKIDGRGEQDLLIVEGDISHDSVQTDNRLLA